LPTAEKRLPITDYRWLIHRAEKLIRLDSIEDPEYTVVVDGFEDYSGG